MVKVDHLASSARGSAVERHVLRIRLALALCGPIRAILVSVLAFLPNLDVKFGRVAKDHIPNVRFCAINDGTGLLDEVIEVQPLRFAHVQLFGGALEAALGAMRQHVVWIGHALSGFSPLITLLVLVNARCVQLPFKANPAALPARVQHVRRVRVALPVLGPRPALFVLVHAPARSVGGLDAADAAALLAVLVHVERIGVALSHVGPFGAPVVTVHAPRRRR
mmetsp:Transcript_17033/g.31839  ORF Transcript_17033/g.31839 Transcript_17033/m.31839 type:complete len:222 (-) Transcript_17033:99-764(-)